MKNHIVFKFIAILLCAAMLALALGCGAATVVLVENGLFDRSIDDLRQERQESACLEMCYYLAGSYALEKLSNCTDDILWEIGAYSELESWIYSGYAVLFEDGEWFYTIKNENGRTLDGTQQDDSIAATYEANVTYTYPMLAAEHPVVYEEYDSSTEPTHLEEEYEQVTEPVFLQEVPPIDLDIDFDYNWTYYDSATGTEMIGYFRDVQTPEYTVTLYLTDDAFSIYEAADWHLLETAQQYRYYLIGGLLIGLLLFAVLLVYLCCAAGKKPGSAEIAPQAFNRLPLDVYAAGGALGIAALISLAGAGYRGLDNSGAGESYLPQLVFIASAVLGICLIVVAFCFACAAQFKMPGAYWLRHSAVGICCVYGWKITVFLWNGLVKVCTWLAVHLPPVLKNIAATLWAWLRFLWNKLCTLLKKGWYWLAKGLRWLGSAVNRTYSLLPLTWQWLLTGFIIIGILYLAICSRASGPLLLGVGICIAVVLYGANCFGILMESAKRMSKGDLETKVSDQFLAGSFKEFAGDLNALADVAVVAAEKQMRSERMKAELVTNVSHDIKTPLTSIINYVDLLQKATTPEEMEEYLEVLERQSQRMKKLIEDLMEMSKATTGNITVDIRQVDAVEAINQALGEFADKLAAAQLTPIFNQPEAPVRMEADGRLVWRVLSNLLSNAVKYALPGTRLYIDLVTLEDKVLISLKNISKEQLNVSSEELMERFVRGDASRNTEGSGLGLNIAKSLMDLQHGQLQLLVDGDLFKATLIFHASKEA